MEIRYKEATGKKLVCPLCGRSTVILEEGTGTVITSLCARCGKPVRWDFSIMQAIKTEKINNIRYD